jgi:DNA-directed RNA polymerase alpha subunit
MEIYAFNKKIGRKLEQAILAAGGINVREVLQQMPEKSLVIKAFHLLDRREFPQGSELENVLDSRVDDLKLSTRSINILRSYFSGSESPHVLQVVMINELDALKVKGCGSKIQVEIRNVLRSLGLDFIDCLPQKERQLVELIVESRS